MEQVSGEKLVWLVFQGEGEAKLFFNHKTSNHYHAELGVE